MSNKNNPCFECPRRYPGCFAACEDYKAWKAEHEARKKKVKEARTQDARLTHYAVEMRAKNKKRNGR